MTAPRSDVAFTSAVKAIQAARGSRDPYAKMEARGGFHDCLTDELAAFLAGVDTAFLATANVGGQPYVQHRGGPKGNETRGGVFTSATFLTGESGMGSVTTSVSEALP